MITRTRFATPLVACTLSVASLFVVSSSFAQSGNASASASLDSSRATASTSGMTVSVKVEPGIALPLSQPQTDHMGIGGGGMAKLGLGVHPLIDLQAGAGFLGFGGKGTLDFNKAGDLVTIAMLAAGARLQRPHEDGALSPWVDADLGFVQTGDLSRFGYAVGGGVQFGLGETRSTWIGPFVRFVQVTSGDKPDVNADDARIFMAGLTLELEVVGRGVKDTDGDGIPDTEDKCPTKPGPKPHGCPDTDGDGLPDHEDRCPNDPGPASNQGCPTEDQDGDGVPDKEDRCPTVAGPKENKGCPDSDGDSINDADDQCPSVKGEPDNKGCPRYKQVVVKESKIEISQKIFFAFNQATILPKSFDILDEVAQALKDAPSLRVRIEGHTDATGSVEHNLALSEARASAVREYLIGQGITPERLESKGYGPTLPLETNATAEGRERNRRVEFVILNNK